MRPSRWAKSGLARSCTEIQSLLVTIMSAVVQTGCLATPGRLPADGQMPQPGMRGNSIKGLNAHVFRPVATKSLQSSSTNRPPETRMKPEAAAAPRDQLRSSRQAVAAPQAGRI